jgi:hypothetical protein
MNLAQSAMRMFEHHKQAEDRIHRVEQPVEVFEIIPIEDVDEHIQRESPEGSSHTQQDYSKRYLWGD